MRFILTILLLFNTAMAADTLILRFPPTTLDTIRVTVRYIEPATGVYKAVAGYAVCRTDTAGALIPVAWLNSKRKPITNKWILQELNLR